MRDVFNMADRVAGGVSTATVLVDNNSELSETACVCCAKLKIELINTRTELESTQRTVELLKEKVELNTSNQIVGSGKLPVTK
jgi:hypothetical protein